MEPWSRYSWSGMMLEDMADVRVSMPCTTGAPPPEPEPDDGAEDADEAAAGADMLRPAFRTTANSDQSQEADSRCPDSDITQPER